MANTETCQGVILKHMNEPPIYNSVMVCPKQALMGAYRSCKYHCPWVLTDHAVSITDV